MSSLELFVLILFSTSIFLCDKFANIKNGHNQWVKSMHTHTDTLPLLLEFGNDENQVKHINGQ